MVATCTASLRLEKTTNKNMYSRGNTATYHYYAALPRGIAAYVLFRGIAANSFAALPLLFSCGMPQMCSRNIAFCLSRHFRGIAAFVLLAFFGNKVFVALVSLIAKISTT